MKHLNIQISGQVQGVYFRTSAKKEADILNLKGFVQNLSDGSVYIEVEGKPQNLEKFLKWCQNGPDLAKVKNIQTGGNGFLKNFTNFEIINN